MTDLLRDRIIKNVPFAVTKSDEIPAQRYYDPEFYRLECEKLWPRVWQMACRLEEIPKRGDYVVYNILDQSILVVRVDEQTVKAYQNHCRHRGMLLAKDDRGRRPNGFVCSFHGWHWNIDGTNRFVYTPEEFDSETIAPDKLGLREVRLETWGGCAFINLDSDAPPLRESIEPFATIHDAMGVEDLKVEWWLAARLDCNWKLAMEAFQEGYHVMATHPQLIPTGATAGPGSKWMRIPDEFITQSRYATVPSKPMPTEVESAAFIADQIRFMRIVGEGMGNGMFCAKDLTTADTLRSTELPKDVNAAYFAWRKKYNEAIMAHHAKMNMPLRDLNDAEAKHYATTVNFCFPHFFLLPTGSSAASYRIRPLGPEACLFELWSLQHYPKDEVRPPLKTPEPMEFNDPRWPPIPTQDFSNLPFQQKGLHSKDFGVMRLSKECEGMISNNHRLIDGYLAGLGYDKLTPASCHVSGMIDQPVNDLGF